MDFSEEISALAARAQKAKGNLGTEEATKTALVLPFIQALGYDMFNPLEVVPEFIADIPGMKGEKVDYAIMHEGNPSIMIECKCCGVNLDDVKKNQLHRYFVTQNSVIAILTDGIRYMFFAKDAEGKKMDEEPFMEFNLDDIDPTLIPELRKLCKGKFDLKKTLDTVSELKFNRQCKLALGKNLEAPDMDFIDYLLLRAGIKGVRQQKKEEQYAGYVKRAFNEFVAEQIDARLKSALAATPKKDDAPSASQSDSAQSIVYGNVQGGGIETTEEEIEGFHIVKAILREVVDPSRVFLRDGINYCSVVLDDSRIKVLCRMHFNSDRTKYFETLDLEKKVSTKSKIESLNDIYRHTDALKATAVLLAAKGNAKAED